MSTNRRQFLKAFGGAGTASLVAVGVQGVHSQSVALPAETVPDLAWDDPTKLSADDGDQLDFFGESAALSGDGRTALIGAPNDDQPSESGSAYVFTWSGSSWGQETKLTAGNPDSRDNFGHDVALSASGDTALVTNENDADPISEGASAGSAYVFTRSGSSWSQQAKLAADDAAAADHFGQSGSLSMDGSVALVGSPGDENDNGVSAGSAYVYARSDGSWSQQQKLIASDGEPSDELGRDVALSGDGTLALVSAESDSTSATSQGSVYVYEQSGGTWSEQTRLVPSNSTESERFGFTVGLSRDGTTAAVGAAGPTFPGAEGAGATYVFEFADGTWSQQARLTHDGGGGVGFAQSLALSGDGSTIFVGSPNDSDPNGENSGSVTVFGLSEDTWSKQRDLSASDGDSFDLFGTGAALSAGGNVGLVGARGDEDPNGDRAGSAYVSGTVPEQSTATPAPSTPTPGSDQMSGTTTTAPDTEESGTETAGGSGPGFGILAAAASVVTAGYLLGERLQDGDGSD